MPIAAFSAVENSPETFTTLLEFFAEIFVEPETFTVAAPLSPA